MNVYGKITTRQIGKNLFISKVNYLGIGNYKGSVECTGIKKRLAKDKLKRFLKLK